jgi:hypothetical protein
MIRQIPVDVLDEVLFVPRAVVAISVSKLAQKFAFNLVEAEDDLDHFEGLILSLNGDVPFTLTHHRGNDPGQTTVSLPVYIGKLRGFEPILGRIADELNIAHDTIIWQQDRDDPPRIYA